MSERISYHERKPGDIETVPMEPREPHFADVPYGYGTTDGLPIGGASLDMVGKAEEKDGLVQWVKGDGHRVTRYIAFNNDPDLLDTLLKHGIREKGDTGGITLDLNGRDADGEFVKLMHAYAADNYMHKLAVERGLRERVVRSGDRRFGIPDVFNQREVRFIDHSHPSSGGSLDMRGDRLGPAVDFKYKDPEINTHAESGAGYRDKVGQFCAEHGIITLVQGDGKVISVADSPFARERLAAMGYKEDYSLGVPFANPPQGSDMAKVANWLLIDREKEPQ